MAVIVIIGLLLLVSIFFVLPSGYLVVTTASHQGCPPAPGQSTTVSAPAPNYDVQQVMVFTQSYAQLAFNVTAIAQCDSSGYGPSYLLNGLTNTGYWYQVGIEWNWPLQSGGYTPGFGFVSEGWAPGGFTRSSPFVPFSGTVNSGDAIELSLTFSGGQVVASAADLKTGAGASTTYPARSATSFIGSQAQQAQPRFSFATQGYFTGLMTEWYHVTPNYSGLEQPVTYSSGANMISSATIGVGEWNFTSNVPGTVFSQLANGGNPIIFTGQLQTFSLSGYSLSGSASEFITST